MSGKVPISRRTSRRKASALYEDFTGHDADEIEIVKKPVVPDAMAVIGELHAVVYSTVRDGKPELYRHEFRKSSRPLLCSGPDGKSLWIIGGEYEFTERGIVDK